MFKPKLFVFLEMFQLFMLQNLILFYFLQF